MRWLGLIALCFLIACRSADEVSTPDTGILVEETFTAGQLNESWLLEGDSVGRSMVANGRLLLEIDQPNTLQYATLQDPILTDFNLTVEARLLEGDLDSSYGVLFRVQNQQFYRFDITGSGMYMIERRNADGTWSRLLDDWTAHAAINQGFTVTNQLQIITTGQTLRFLVNGILVQEVRDSAQISGNIALDAGTFGQGGLRVAFDNLIIREP